MCPDFRISLSNYLTVMPMYESVLEALENDFIAFYAEILKLWNRIRVVNVALVVKKFIIGHVPTKKKWLNYISVIVSVLTGSILYEFERLAGCFDLF